MDTEEIMQQGNKHSRKKKKLGTLGQKQTRQRTTVMSLIRKLEGKLSMNRQALVCPEVPNKKAALFIGLRAA